MIPTKEDKNLWGKIWFLKRESRTKADFLLCSPSWTGISNMPRSGDQHGETKWDSEKVKMCRSFAASQILGKLQFALIEQSEFIHRFECSLLAFSLSIRNFPPCEWNWSKICFFFCLCKMLQCERFFPLVHIKYLLKLFKMIFFTTISAKLTNISFPNNSSCTHWNSPRGFCLCNPVPCIILNKNVPADANSH